MEWSDYPANIEWTEAIRGTVPVVEHIHCWTVGNAVVSWSGRDARRAHRLLARAARLVCMDCGVRVGPAATSVVGGRCCTACLDVQPRQFAHIDA